MFYIRIEAEAENLLNIGAILLEKFKIYARLENLEAGSSENFYEHVDKFCQQQLEDFLKHPDHKLFLRDFLIVLLQQGMNIETMYEKKKQATGRVIEETIKTDDGSTSVN